MLKLINNTPNNRSLVLTARACEQAASEASREVTRKLAAISRVGLLLSLFSRRFLPVAS